MDGVTLIKERIRQGLVEALLPSLMKGVAVEHFERGYKTGCQCAVCDYRRQYVRAQETSPPGRTTLYGGWRDLREERRHQKRRIKKALITSITGETHHDYPPKKEVRTGWRIFSHD